MTTTILHINSLVFFLQHFLYLPSNITQRLSYHVEPSSTPTTGGVCIVFAFGAGGAHPHYYPTHLRPLFFPNLPSLPCLSFLTVLNMHQINTQPVRTCTRSNTIHFCWFPLNLGQVPPSVQIDPFSCMFGNSIVICCRVQRCDL